MYVPVGPKPSAEFYITSFRVTITGSFIYDTGEFHPQVIWVCILCRKKQELLSKTGQWINKGMGGDPVMRRIEADLVQDKRPKLERAHSAAEKENQPLLHRSSSVLKRQYSQQDTSKEREEEALYYRSELDGLMRQHQQQYQLPGARNDSLSSEQSSSLECGPRAAPTPASRKHRRSGSAKKQPGTVQSPGQRCQQQIQRSFSSSDDDLRSTPDCTSCEEHESEQGECTRHISPSDRTS